MTPEVIEAVRNMLEKQTFSDWYNKGGFDRYIRGGGEAPEVAEINAKLAKWLDNGKEGKPAVNTITLNQFTTMGAAQRYCRKREAALKAFNEKGNKADLGVNQLDVGVYQVDLVGSFSSEIDLIDF